MSATILVASLFILLILFGIGIFFYIKFRKKEEIYETEEAEEETGYVIEETEEGCPEEIKKKLLNEQETLFKEAYKVYMVIKYALKGKQLPPEIKKELQTFIRAYNRLEEMKEEIQLYPFSDCEKVFKLKFEFYNNLIHTTAKKIMYLTKKVS